MTYSEQLKSPKWQKKRLEILERDKYTCQSCMDTESQLHVHHGYYSKNKMLWEYKDFTLHTLCSCCHEKAHEDLDHIKYLIGSLSVESFRFLINILENTLSRTEYPDYYYLAALSNGYNECVDMGLKSLKKDEREYWLD
jgi:hypothetical protein